MAKKRVESNDGEEFDLNKLLEAANKSFKCDIGQANKPEFELSLVPTGITVLDRLLGGGYPRSRMHIITGPFGTGKTYICHNIVANFQKQDLSCIWIDAERRYNPQWATKIGVDTQKVILNRPTSGEESIDLILFYLSKKVDLIIVDSLAALSPLAEIKADMEQKFMGLQSNMFSTAFRKIIPENKNTVLICINQLRQTIGSRFNPGVLKKMPGGDAQYYYATSITEITRKGWITEKGEDGGDEGDEKLSAKRRSIGFNINCFLEKCDFAQPYKSCDIPFNFVTAKIDGASSILDLAIDLDLITHGGAWYYYGEEKFMGKQKMLDWFNEDPIRLQELQAKI
jgi:recombination protein RecA